MTRNLMWIFWPSFLMAGAATGLLFSTFDPRDLHCFGESFDWSRQAVYTLGFFLFWAMGAACATMTLVLSRGLENRA